jgi:hypothetical protein
MKNIIIFICSILLGSSTAYSQCALEKNIFPFTINGKKYEVVLQKMIWGFASDCAKERGGNLARINNKEENDSIVNYLKNEFPIKTGLNLVDGIYETNHLFWIGAIEDKDRWYWTSKSKRDTSTEFFAGIGSFGHTVNDYYVNWGSIDDKRYFPHSTTVYPQALTISLNPFYDTTESRVKSTSGQWINQTYDILHYFLIEYDCKETLYNERVFSTCMGDSIVFAGDTIRKSGVYRDTTVSYSDCDSISTLTVYINNMKRDVKFDGKEIRVFEPGADSYKWYNCNNDSIEIDNDKEYYIPLETGKYKVKITKDLCEFTSDCYEVCFPNKSRLDTIKCENDPVFINDVEYTKRGFYEQNLKQIGFDCDSVLEIDIEDVRFDKRIKESNDTLFTYESNADYQWYNCEDNLPIVDAKSRGFAPIEEGYYKVEITKQGCIDYSECYYYTIARSRIMDIKDSDIIRIDEINKLIVLDDLIYDEIELIDLNSKIIYKTEKMNQAISIEFLTNGAYFLKVINGNKVEMFKFMVVE